jgi:hypothetical protein
MSTTPVVHVVAEMADGVQACLRCGEVILDYRGTVTNAPSVAIRGFAPGAVTSFPGGTTAGAADDALPCGPIVRLVAN